MRAIVFVCASALLSTAPAWAQQDDAKAASASTAVPAPHAAQATHKSLNPIGQALDSLLREAGRSQRAAHDMAAGANTAAAPAHEADSPTNATSAPVEIAVH